MLFLGVTNVTPDRWRQVRELVESALDLPTTNRGDYLARACHGDADLCTSARSLLAFEDTAADFLESPIEGAAELLTAEVTALTARGERIGPYRLTGIVATGGMGTVYRAVRDDDAYQKQVAIKLIRPDLASASVLRRFRAERQVLANLEHPNITRLLDGGTCPDGAPYLVMEYVDGTPIDDYCDASGLSLVPRLQLFRTVCSAVQSAHQNLVVHRDLKPANILVTPDGAPKLLDFGIAAILTGATPANQTLLHPMTPRYASPEQIRGEPVTTATDVYSLGVILYELLSGRYPFEPPAQAPYDLERMICEVEPRKPSLAAITSGPYARMRRRLRGDLDNIVLKAMHKDPRRRYVSVEHFSQDVLRHLEGLPVTARPDTLLYRSVKFVRRQAAGVAAVAAVVAGLIVAVVGTTRGMWRADLARQRADQEAARVTRERENASTICALLDEMLSDEVTGLGRPHLGAGAWLEWGVEPGLAVLSDTTNEPDSPEALLATAAACARFGDLAEAEELLRRIARNCESAGASPPQVCVDALSGLALLLFERGCYYESREIFTTVLAQRREQLGESSPRTLETLASLAEACRVTNRAGEAEALYRQAMDVIRTAPAIDAQVSAMILCEFGVFLKSEGRYAEAEPLLREALALFRGELGEQHSATGRALINLASVRRACGDYDGAVELYQQALDSRRSMRPH